MSARSTRTTATTATTTTTTTTRATRATGHREAATATAATADATPFHLFITDRLIPDLEAVVSRQEELHSQLAELIKLQAQLRLFKKQKLQTLRTKVDIGENFYANAVVDDFQTAGIFLDIGAGIFLEHLTIDEALEYVDTRIDGTNERTMELGNKAHTIHQRITAIQNSLDMLERVNSGGDIEDFEEALKQNEELVK